MISDYYGANILSLASGMAFSIIKSKVMVFFVSTSIPHKDTIFDEVIGNLNNTGFSSWF